MLGVLDGQVLAYISTTLIRLLRQVWMLSVTVVRWRQLFCSSRWAAAAAGIKFGIYLSIRRIISLPEGERLEDVKIH